MAPVTYDVVVAGAGPAGAAVARELAAAGVSVLLAERGRFDAERPGERPGETLAPSVRPLLDALGVWERFAALGPLPSWGTRSVWGGGEPVERSHLTSAYGSGWHVDRAAFDRMLAEAAADAGATLRTGTAVTGCHHDGDRWRVTTSTGAVGCRVLVDATGRRAAAARALGARRVAFDRLTALAATWPADVRREGYLLVEAVPEGWWYTAPLPAGELVAVLMTDADVSRRAGLVTRWRERLGAAPATAARLGGGEPTAARVFPAASHRLLRAGDYRPWLAVGDAALAVDPASGSGVVRALRSASAGTWLTTRLLEHPAEAAALLDRHESARNDECTAHLTERAGYYAIERRFRTPFWTRRAPFQRFGTISVAS
jgi:flavin-dependent dehydrogenase